MPTTTEHHRGMRHPWLFDGNNDCSTAYDLSLDITLYSNPEIWQKKARIMAFR